MCFHSKQSKKAIELKTRFKASIQDEHQFKEDSNINGFTFPKTPIITHNETNIIKHFNWGLIPSWAKDNSIRRYTLNAKIETLAEKPSFKNAINKRCLVITDGFYEWKWLDTKGKSKQKYLITYPNNQIFTFGGIWSEWIDKTTGECICSYSIVTTEANEFMSEIHNSKKRMPVLLTENTEKNWLEGDKLENFKKIEVDLIAKAV